MNAVTCIVGIFNNSSDVNSFTLRQEVEEFLVARKGKLLGAGRSCMVDSYSDIEVKFRSEKTGERVVGELMAAFLGRCEISVEWD